MLTVSRSRTQTVALAPFDPLFVSPSLEKQKKGKKGRRKKGSLCETGEMAEACQMKAF